MSKLLQEKAGIEELNRQWGGVNFEVGLRKGWIGYTSATTATHLFTAPEEIDPGLIRFLTANSFTRIKQSYGTRWSFASKT